MTSSNVLVVNAGSSSLRLRVLDRDDGVVAEQHVADHRAIASDTIASFIDDLPAAVGAVGHRVVHGGHIFPRATLVDAAVIEAVASLTPLAPLHQPAAVDAMRTVATVLPDVPAVACFDTSFHATIPDAAATYAIPATWRERWHARRFGFHGLSHSYASRRAAELLRDRGTDAEQARVVTCHLGAGASLCATKGGRSVDTTMGFTPSEGLVMATRSGTIDPGLLLWLITEGAIDPHEVERALRTESGLAGLAEGSGDMREVIARRAAGDRRAELAFAVYSHRLVTSIGAMAVACGGLDALVFTGGVGEHEPLVRSVAARSLTILGVEIDESANAAVVGGSDADITARGAGAATFVVLAREDLEIAREVRAALGPATGP